MDQKEFRKAIKAIGFNAPNQEIDALFKQIDKE